MQSDPWWSLAMAVNVYMVFFMAYNPNNFHRHLWMYCVVCFGVPAVPAVVMLFHRPGDVHMYGNATVCPLFHPISQHLSRTYLGSRHIQLDTDTTTSAPMAASVPTFMIQRC